MTVICEPPRIGPHREMLRARIAAIAGIPLDRVAVKATTSEKLGFIGRGEGIAALATATIGLPGRLLRTMNALDAAQAIFDRCRQEADDGRRGVLTAG